MRLLAVDHVQITIPPGAEDEARAFYCGILGIREIEKPEVLKGRGGLWLDLAGSQVHIGTEKSDPKRNATKAHVAYLVENVESCRKVLTNNGIAITDGIQIPSYVRFEFRDPFGNRVEFLQCLK